jgi:hypothetical protein
VVKFADSKKTSSSRMRSDVSLDGSERMYPNSKGGGGGSDPWFQQQQQQQQHHQQHQQQPSPVHPMTQMQVRDPFMLDTAAMMRGDSRVMYPYPNSPAGGPPVRMTRDIFYSVI